MNIYDCQLISARFDTPAAQKLRHSGNIHWVIDEDATSGLIRFNSKFVVTHGKLIETHDIFVFTLVLYLLLIKIGQIAPSRYSVKRECVQLNQAHFVVLK